MKTKSNQLPNLWHDQLQGVFQDFMLYYSKMQTFQDPEDLHQLRVSLRKMQVLILFLKNHNTKKNELLEFFLNQIKALARVTGKLRDYDVMVIYLQTVFKPKDFQAKVQPLLQILRREQIIEQQRLLLQLPNLYNASFQKSWQKITKPKQLKRWVRNTEIESDFKELIQKFKKRHQTYLKNKKKRGATDCETVSSLHKLRLQSKKLRYAYTYLAFALEENSEKKVKKYKKMQNHFGEINDLYNLHECLVRLEHDYPYVKLVAQPLIQVVQQDLTQALENVKIK